MLISPVCKRFSPFTKHARNFAKATGSKLHPKPFWDLPEPGKSQITPASFEEKCHAPPAKIQELFARARLGRQTTFAYRPSSESSVRN